MRPFWGSVSAREADILNPLMEYQAGPRAQTSDFQVPKTIQLMALGSLSLNSHGYLDPVGYRGGLLKFVVPSWGPIISITRIIVC